MSQASWVSSWRTSIRIARREARRSRGRSLLVVAMIAVPALCLSFAAVSYDMFTLNPAERASQHLGTADARIQWPWQLPTEQSVDGDGYWPASHAEVASKEEFAERNRPGTTAELRDRLPEGTRVVPLVTGNMQLRTAHGIGGLDLVALDATDPIASGYVRVLAGRAPGAGGEMALTPQAAARLGQGLGGTVTAGDGMRSYTVVGLVEFPAALKETVLVAPSDQLGSSPSPGMWLVDTPDPVDWQEVRSLNQYGIVVASRAVVLNPPPVDQVPSGRPDGLLPDSLALGVIVVGLAIFEIVLLAGPAFAISARRRQRQLALIAASGGTPAHLRRVVLADGLVLGLLGAAVGVALGIVAAFTARPWVELTLAHYRAGAYRVFPMALAAIAGLAVLTGLLAALMPALIAARLNVVAALAGRRGVVRSRKRWLAAGLVLVGIGAAAAIYGATTVSADLIVAGLAAGELGLVACTPALVGLIARSSRLLPLSPRVALRDAARNRAAAAPAISAVMAAVAGSVAIGLYVGSTRAQQAASYEASVPPGSAVVYLTARNPDAPAPDVATIEATMRSMLPIAEVRTVSTVVCPDETPGLGQPPPGRLCGMLPVLPPQRQCPYAATLAQRALSAEEQRAARRDDRCRPGAGSSVVGSADGSVYVMGSGEVIVDDGTALGVYTGATAADVAGASAVLRTGGVVVYDDRFVEDGRVTFTVIDIARGGASGPVQQRQVAFPAYVLTSAALRAGAVVSPAALAQVGFSAEPALLVGSTTRMPTTAERDRFQYQSAQLDIAGVVELGPDLDTDARLWIIVAAAAAITLGATAISTGLAAADGRADLSTLAAVGASPRVRRGISLSQAGVIAGLGSLLGAAAGLAAAAAVIVASNQQYADIWPAPEPMPVAVPWINLAVAMVVVPVLAMLGAGALTRTRLPIERRPG